MSATTDPATDTAPDNSRNCTPPPQPDADKEAFSTPYGINHRPAKQNMYAKHVHWYNAEAMKPVVEDTFFEGKPQTHDVKPKMKKKMSSDADIELGLEAVASFTQDDLENRRYAPTIKLLNRISSLYFEISRRGPEQAAIVFTFAPTRKAPGSFLGEEFQPDYLAYVASVAELREAVSAENGLLLPWSVLIGVGEHKRYNEERLAQLKTYTSLLKRYRPDLPAIHGFHVSGDEVEIASLDTVFRMSKACPVDTLEPWLALVASLYHAADTRYQPLTYNSSQLDFHRWDVEYEDLKIATVPFHVGEAPGRTTFAALELAPGGATQDALTKAFYESPAYGFFKSSWQSATARWTESELLERIHKDGWLPGVVRPRFTRREAAAKDPTAQDAERKPGAQSAKAKEVEKAKEPEQQTAQTQEQTAQTQATTAQTAQTQATTAQTQAKTTPLRVREVINLGSIGEPLSEARTMRHLLWAFYDFVETSSQLAKLGIIHRDLSWFNCLILPRHTVAGEKRPLSRPCIRRILEAANVKIDTTLETIGKRQPDDVDIASAGQGEAVDEFMPCTLVADFDHSADIEQLQDTQQKLNIRERTGTNMFIACDLSDPGSAPHTNKCSSLPKALDQVCKNPRGSAALAAALPNDDHAGFQDMIKRVVADESERQDQVTLGDLPPPSVPKGLHEPRHDAESLFWVHLWGCARAQPVLSTVPDADRSQYNHFCATMLSHRIRGGNKEAGRSLYLTPEPLQRPLFHPRFKRVQAVFVQMALYLSIPWHLYEDDPYIKKHPDHAHVAFRRLLLGMLLRNDMPELDDLLNTEEPRVVENLENVLQFAVPSQRRAATGNESISQSASKSVAVEKEPPAADVSDVVINRRGELDRRAQFRSENAQVPLPKKEKKKKKEPKPSTPALTPASTSTSQVSTRSQKRAREETHADDGAAKKMRADVQHEQDVQPMAVDEPEREPVAEDQPQVDTMADEANEDAPAVVDKTQRYTAEVHQPLQTVNALRLKIWKDKALWFGKGKFSPLPQTRKETAAKEETAA